MAASEQVETNTSAAMAADGGGASNGTTSRTTTGDVDNNASSSDQHNNNNNNSHVDVLQGLRRLSLSLQQLDDKTMYAAHMSHYRKVPTACLEAYDILQQGAALIHGTSTKFTLMEKMIPNSETTKHTREMATNLLKGCELVATACLVLHETRSTGTSTACRHYVKQASRAIVQTVHQLVQTFEGNDNAVAVAAAHEEDNALGAQRTGAVWQACNVILEKSSSSSMPRGNRNCMRRRLFSYMAECRETWQEFQDLIDLGPSAQIEEEDEEYENEDKQSKKPPPAAAASSAAKTGEDDDDDDDAEKDDARKDDDDGWFQFLSGQDQQYADHEIPVATAALALIKISRGAINLADQACEAVGERLRENDENDSNVDTVNDNIEKERKQELLTWMETLHHLACAVGDGMTDLGATLYPPLQLLPPPLTEPVVASESETKSSSPSSPSSPMSPCSEVEVQIDRQAYGAIAPLLNHVLDFAAAAVSTNTMDSSDLPETVVELATKLKENLSTRHAQALQAIVTAVAEAA